MRFPQGPAHALCTNGDSPSTGAVRSLRKRRNWVAVVLCLCSLLVSLGCDVIQCRDPDCGPGDLTFACDRIEAT